MPVTFDQVEGRVVGDGPARGPSDEPREPSGAGAARSDDILREIERTRRLEERLKAD
jgi:hypothetical protein